MSSDFIPDDVAQFIIERIDSVAQMEALLLFRSDPQQEWSAEDLAGRLYISEPETATVVERLSSGGFLAAQGDRPLYRYQPASTELQKLVDRVAEIYLKHLVPVTNLIHSKPKTRVQEFAEAFRLRKDK